MTRLIILGFSWLLCVSCGGGGGSSSNGGSSGGAADRPEFSLNVQSLSFVAESRLRGPTAGSITGLVDTTRTGTLYVLIDSTGPAVKSISGLTIGTSSGTARVYVKPPSDLGTGTHTSTITVRACVDSPNCSSGELRGSPRTVAVTYEVRAVFPQRDLVVPRVSMAGTPGDVVIRGANIAGVSSVRFGGQAALSFTQISGTEVRARHPALPSGAYPVTLNGGSLTFNASLAVTAPEPFGAARLDLPNPLPSAGASAPRYDAERRAIYMVLRESPPVRPELPRAQNRLVKYTFASGAWSVPKVTLIPDLYDVILSPDGAYLMGMARNSILDIDPDSLAITATHPADGPSSVGIHDFNFINNLSLTNDGYAVVTFGCICSASTPIYFYSTVSRQFTYVLPDDSVGGPLLDQSSGFNTVSVASGDGGAVLIGPNYLYLPSSGDFRTRTRFANFPPYTPQSVQVDARGTRFVVASGTFLESGGSAVYTDVYDANYQQLGRILEPQPSQGILNQFNVVSADGARVRVFQRNAQDGALLSFKTYDATSPAPSDGTLPQVGATSMLPPTGAMLSSGVTLTPDGQTALFGAANGLFIQPLP